MKRTVVLIDHPIGKRDDRASRMIAERGYRIEWYCPGKGESPPPPGPQHTAAVVYGGAEDLSVDGDRPYLRQEVEWIEKWVATGRPLLGICLGGQLLARALGARVGPHSEGWCEIGYHPVAPAPAANGFLAEAMHVYQWHREGFDLPPDATLLASGEAFPNQAFRFGETAYGIQFHPEVSPSVMRRWLSEASHMLGRPGAHPSDRQVADAERYDAALRDWLAGFLDDWLPPADAAD